LQIIYLDRISSTQNYLISLLKEKKISAPILIYTDNQTDGIGSRNNSWNGEKGDLFLSLAIDINFLPKDIPLSSISIYFAYIFNMVLNDFGSKSFLKWPNDIYIDRDKIGGIITTKIGDNIICGIGLNLILRDKFKNLNIEISKKKILNNFIILLEKKIAWNDIITKYQEDFHLNYIFDTTIDNKKISLKESKLLNDGSLLINNKKVYSLR